MPWEGREAIRSKRNSAANDAQLYASSPITTPNPFVSTCSSRCSRFGQPERRTTDPFCRPVHCIVCASRFGSADDNSQGARTKGFVTSGGNRVTFMDSHGGKLCTRCATNPPDKKRNPANRHCRQISKNTPNPSLGSSSNKN
jgi:hypothetical protein